jgi:hypothetical protein
MSVWGRLSQWVAAAAATPAGAAAAASTLGADVAAAQAGVKFVEDLAAHKATILEGLQAGLSLDKALAPVLPVAVVDDVELAISLAEALIALYSVLPLELQAIKVMPSRPYRGDGVNPETGAPIGV